MMKLKNLIALGILGVLTLGVGVGMTSHANVNKTEALDAIYKSAVFSKDSFSKGVSSYADTFSSTTNGFVIDIKNANNNNKQWDYIKFGSKNSAYVGYMTTHDYIDTPITKVEIDIDDINVSYINSISLYTSSDGVSFDNLIGDYTLEKGLQSLEIVEPAENLFYKISVDCKKADKNGPLVVNGLNFYTTSSSPAVIINEGDVEINKNDNIQLTTSFANVEETQVSWSVENNNIATVDENGLVTAIASGSTKITATINVNDVQYSDSVIVYVLYSEPAPIEIGVADILDTEADPTVLYRVTGKISKLGQDGSGADKYGNIHLADLKNLDTTILVYGSTFTETALTFDNKTGNFQFSNPQDYLTNEQSKALKIGDVVELLVFRLDYKDQKELNGIFTKVYSDEEVVDLFVANYMHPEIDYGDPGTGLCTTEGWYDDAKVAFNQLTDTQRELFATNEKYLQPYARLSAWAKANGDTFDASNMLVSASNNNALIIDEQNYLVIIVTISMLSISVIALFAISKKRKTIKK